MEVVEERVLERLQLAHHRVAGGKRQQLPVIVLDELFQDRLRRREIGVDQRTMPLLDAEQDELAIAAVVVEIEPVAQFLADFR